MSIAKIRAYVVKYWQNIKTSVHLNFATLDGEFHQTYPISLKEAVNLNFNLRLSYFYGYGASMMGSAIQKGEI